MVNHGESCFVAPDRTADIHEQLAHAPLDGRSDAAERELKLSVLDGNLVGGHSGLRCVSRSAGLFREFGSPNAILEEELVAMRFRLRAGGERLVPPEVCLCLTQGRCGNVGVNDQNRFAALQLVPFVEQRLFQFAVHPALNGDGCKRRDVPRTANLDRNIFRDTDAELNRIIGFGCMLCLRAPRTAHDRQHE